MILKQIMVSSIFPKNERKSLSTQDSEFRSFFGRIEEETINCFRDLLIFIIPIINVFVLM